MSAASATSMIRPSLLYGNATSALHADHGQLPAAAADLLGDDVHHRSDDRVSGLDDERTCGAATAGAVRAAIGVDHAVTGRVDAHALRTLLADDPVTRPDRATLRARTGPPVAGREDL